ncbi:hypothetical protein BDR04DRAFT_1091828 [Suillus decipiens]|nr:hypothetical protein BDR04DRAFT_1091828 [Suillus decipiens]
MLVCAFLPTRETAIKASEIRIIRQLWVAIKLHLNQGNTFRIVSRAIERYVQNLREFKKIGF